jgi:hypothetical protein
VIGDHGAIDASPLLFVVESEAVGTAAARLHQRGILVGADDLRRP